MSEQVRARIPKDSIETENDLVQVAVAEPLDRFHLPIGQSRREGDGVGKTLRVLRDGLFQNTERKCAENRVTLVRHGVRVIAGVGRRDLAPGRTISAFEKIIVSLECFQFLIY